MTGGNSEIKIRPAAALDAANIVRLLKHLWHEETAIQADRVNDRKALLYVMETLDQGRVLVAELSGRIVGSIACLTTQERWSDESFLEVRWLYALHNLMRPDIEIALLGQAEVYSDEQDLPLLARVFRYSGNRTDHFGGRAGYVAMGPSYFRIPLATVLSLSSSSLDGDSGKSVEISAIS